MSSLIIFSSSNDIVFKNIHTNLTEKLLALAVQNEYIENQCENELDNNTLIQIFSPIINSQRIMFCQFDNTYSSIQCENNLSFVFDEFLGYLFLLIGTESIEKLKRSVQVSICFAKHLCGPLLLSLKTDSKQSTLFTNLLNIWQLLYDNDQGILLEAIEPIFINSDVRMATSKILQNITEQVKEDLNSQRSIALLLVKGKFLNLFSSRQALKISPSDILFLSILLKMFQKIDKNPPNNIYTEKIYLQCSKNSNYSGCIPYIVHIAILEGNTFFILLIEMGNSIVASSLYETFFVLQKLQNVQMQGDYENLKTCFDDLEIYVKQTIETIKKAKYNSNEIEICMRKFINKWEILKKKYIEFSKSPIKELVVKLESNMPALSEELKELFRQMCTGYGNTKNDIEILSKISTMIEEKLLEFTEFLNVKAERNLPIESYSEDFPGLVHFMYVNRTTGHFTAPDLFLRNTLIPKEKIWSMVEFTRSYLTKGHTSVIWKDTVFNYTYFLWFEDINGTPIKPKDLPIYSSTATPTRPQYEPGILAGDFYQRLCETCFPKSPFNKIKCYEIFCIHLGLVTTTCALEHCRRLVATINDVMVSKSFELT